MKNLILALSLIVIAAATKIYGQCDTPIGDVCSDASDFGLVATTDCADAPTLQTMEGCLKNATPAAGLAGCSEFSTTGTVWYKADYDAEARYITVNIMPGSTWYPRIAIYSGSDCNGLALLSDGCSNTLGMSTNIRTVVNQFGSASPGSVWVAVSYDPGSVNNQSDLSFTIEMIAEKECLECGAEQDCYYNGDITIKSRSIRPMTDTSGYFCPGEEVTVCLNFDHDISIVSLDWLHGLIPNLGKGWDLQSSDLAGARITPDTAMWVDWNDPDGCGVTASVPMTSVRSYYDEFGQLQFSHDCLGHPNGAKPISQGDTMPSGWFYRSISGQCKDPGCSPSDYWGLPESNGVVSVEICLDLKVREDFGSSSCFEDRKLDIKILPTSDAHTGCWSTILSCIDNDVIIFGENWEVECRTSPLTITGDKEVCSGDTTKIDIYNDSFSSHEMFAIDNPSIKRTGAPELISNDSENPTEVIPHVYTIAEVLRNTSDTVQFQTYVMRVLELPERCSYPYDTVTVAVFPEMQLKADSFALCKGSCVSIFPEVSGGSLPYSYNWSDGIMDSTRVVCPEATSSYSLTVQDSNKCMITQEYPVSVIGSGEAVIVNEDSLRILNKNIGSGDTTQFVQLGRYAPSNYTEVMWIPDNGLIVIINEEMPTICGLDGLRSTTGSYKLIVEATDTEGCTSSDTLSISVGDCDIIPYVDNYSCDDMGTSETSDDIFYFDLKITGSGDKWSVSNSQNLVSYGSVLKLGPFNVANGDQKITVQDNTNESCTTTFFVSPPAECELSCDSDPDYNALMAIYDATNGSSWKDNTGWVDGVSQTNCDPCNGWYGIKCDSIGNIIELDLSNNGLEGYLPTDIGLLSSLKYIDLGDNNLEGSIPEEIGELVSLRYLDLHANRMTGKLPVGLAALTSLEYVDLNTNQLSGVIPVQLGSLTSGVSVEAKNDNGTDSNSNHLVGLTSLRHLDLHSNLLTGEIPTNIASMTSLEYLDLGLNELSGTLPADLGDLTALVVLSAHDNVLTGSIRVGLGDLVNLSTLYLQGNQFSGSIPESLANLTSLQNLNLGSNQLSMCIPTSLREFICSVNNIDFSGNPMLPWEGDLDDFCATDGSTASQQGAPCMVNGEAGSIDEDCMCRPMDGVGDIDISTLMIYPNPSRSRVFVQGYEGGSYEIHSIQGEQMVSGVYNHETGIVTKDLSSGIYILRVQTAKGWSLGRFVKE